MTDKEFLPAVTNGEKDLADIARLVEARPDLVARLPAAVRDRLA